MSSKRRQPTALLAPPFGIALIALILGSSVGASDAAAPPRPGTVTLKLNIGGEVFGPVLAHTDDVVVIDYLRRPCAFVFDELTPASAYQTKKELLTAQAGGERQLSAEDHLTLGMYALQRGRLAVANREFRQLLRIDPSYTEQVKDARQAARKKKGKKGRSKPDAPLDQPDSDGAARTRNSRTQDRDSESADRQVIKEYIEFGQVVKASLNDELELIETEHFLIWTDWRRDRSEPLAGWCEKMYAEVVAQFKIPPDQPALLGKAPVFCFRTKSRFLRFAKTFDNYEASNAVGYTRTEPTGRVRIAVYRRAQTPHEVNRFAGTLVHEGVHAVLHRYYKTFNVSGWVGEGMADYIAQQVLGDHCLYGEKARLVAGQYVARDIPIQNLLRVEGMPEAHEYPVAYSLVQFLIERDTEAFDAMIRHQKDGFIVEEALRRAYDGMDFDALEEQWRKWVQSTK